MKKSLKASFPAASSLPPSSTPTITLSALQKKNTKVWNTHTHTPSHTNAYKQNTHARLSHSLVYFLSIFFSLFFCVGTRRCISSLFESYSNA
jgi:lipopolysaccharide export LptBFGC system permease protein LptF